MRIGKDRERGRKEVVFVHSSGKCSITTICAHSGSTNTKKWVRVFVRIHNFNNNSNQQKSSGFNMISWLLLVYFRKKKRIIRNSEMRKFSSLGKPIQQNQNNYMFIISIYISFIFSPFEHFSSINTVYEQTAKKK